MTTTRENISGVIKVLDEYMIRSGKEEINEMEANRELAKAGLLADEQAHPGRHSENGFANCATPTSCLRTLGRNVVLGR